MRTSAPGTPAHIKTIPADKIAFIIELLQEHARNAQAKADRETQNETGKFYYLGRGDAFAVAVYWLREVAK